MSADRNARGVVFNIQKFSVNDGPGIRTVVFLKGCPLRCQWCANPESQSVRPQVLWDSKKCLHCENCVAVCPYSAVSAQGDRIRVDARLCQACGMCVNGCPVEALTLSGEEKSVQEVLDVVLQDLPFYEESGGGITLSGGEMLMQPEFAFQLLTAAKEEGLATCVETTGMAAPEVFERVIGPVDEILFDMKHWDSSAHRRGTSVGNEVILGNLARATRLAKNGVANGNVVDGSGTAGSAGGKTVLVRIPVIPGYNDSLEDAAGFAEKMHEVGARRCQLLPFHQFGENKYDLLGADYAYRDVPALHREELEEYRQVFLSHGIEAFF
ncbi:MAG: glycyl-radical enzyme activating protein [Firmicutes bacterium]|nr:glycyl-radical enzyme activating protein [Bacillota bacterium]